MPEILAVYPAETVVVNEKVFPAVCAATESVVTVAKVRFHVPAGLLVFPPVLPEPDVMILPLTPGITAVAADPLVEVVVLVTSHRSKSAAELREVLRTRAAALI